MPAYKSYCWSLGTTSFRMVEFNRKIEEQLKLLVEPEERELIRKEEERKLQGVRKRKREGRNDREKMRGSRETERWR